MSGSEQRRKEMREILLKVANAPRELLDAEITSALDELEEIAREAASDGYDDGVRDGQSGRG